MPFDPEKFKNTCSGVQSIALVIAIIVGGIWTIISLDLFGQVDRARAELEQIQKQLESQAVLEIEIVPSQVALSGDNYKYLSVEVNVRNAGNRNTVLEYKSNSPPFRAWPVSFDKSGSLDFGDPIAAHPTPSVEPESRFVSGTKVWAGQEKTIPFFLRLPASGLYSLEFTVNVSEQELGAVAETGVEARHVLWTAKKYFVVR